MSLIQPIICTNQRFLSEISKIIYNSKKYDKNEIENHLNESIESAIESLSLMLKNSSGGIRSAKAIGN